MAMAHCSTSLPPALKRLHSDLKALQESPLVGAAAEPISDSDMTKWCGIILPPESSLLSGIPIRFTLEFPNEYPNLPPKAYFETYIAYDNGATMKDSQGRIEVCLNIFGNFSKIHTEWGSSSEGWSPSYTVTTILVSMQGMMMDGMLSERLSDVKEMSDSAINFRCPLTKHDGSDPTKYFPRVITCPQEAAEIAQKHSTSQNTPLDTHYICYGNNTCTGRLYVLGYGVQVQNTRLGTLSSPCEYLALPSYRNGNIRKSSTNIPFTHWLPILIENWDWSKGKDIRRGFLFFMEKICADIEFNGSQSQAQKVFKICSSLMNSLVVEIMNNGTDLTANDKFINAYFSFYRILRMFKEDLKLGALADSVIGKSLRQNGLRKANIPNLGEFLIYLAISDKYKWGEIAEDFLLECDARNVFWYVKGNRNNPPRYPELGSMSVVGLKERAQAVWDATGVSRRLVMFQIRFCNVAMNLEESGMFDMEDFENYGLVDEGVRGELKGVYNQVMAVEGWKGFYEWVGLEKEDVDSDTRRGRELVAAVARSRQLKYI